MSDSLLEVQYIPVADLTLDDALQPRCEIDVSLIEDYAALLMEGTELPPLAVFRDAANRLWLADGFHRLRAHQTLDRTEVPCLVHSGERAEAIRHSVIANAAHGKPRSRGDLARSYDILKREGLVEPGDADRVQALLQCSGGWAYKLTQADRDRAKRERDRAILEKHGEGKSEREIARETGVLPQTVHNVLNRVPKKSSVEIFGTPLPGGLEAPVPEIAMDRAMHVEPSSEQGQALPDPALREDGHRNLAAPLPPATDCPKAAPTPPRYEDYVDPVALEAWYRVIKALQAFTALQPVPDLIQSPCPQVFYAVDAALPAARAWLHRFEQEFDHVKQLSEIA
jgi:DNA-binding NarL/FixJ family response regulator